MFRQHRLPRPLILQVTNSLSCHMNNKSSSNNNSKPHSSGSNNGVDGQGG